MSHTLRPGGAGIQRRDHGEVSGGAKIAGRASGGRRSRAEAGDLRRLLHFPEKFMAMNLKGTFGGHRLGGDSCPPITFEAVPYSNSWPSGFDLEDHQSRTLPTCLSTERYMSVDTCVVM